MPTVPRELLETYAYAMDMLEYAVLEQDDDSVVRHQLYVEACRSAIIAEACENGSEPDLTLAHWIHGEVSKIRRRQKLHAN